ncbi:hypothetical protein KJ903_01685 [Patescibacteria group bacterium]|nr:hypothetical protein [Patescibacteria group bacterium]
MAKLKQMLVIPIAVFGLLIVAGTALASPADTLQPASTITYNEEVVVNNTVKANSAYIGSTAAGVGGVTFFNGTIVNNAVDSSGNNTIPVTFGDDVRIDGEIYRTEIGGENPLKLADTIRPQTSNVYDLGTSSYQFKDGYFAGALNAGSITTAGSLIAGSVATTGSLAAGSITTSGALSAGSIITAGSLTAGDIVTAGTVDGVDVSAIPSTYVSQSSPSWDSRNGKTSVPASSCIPEDNGISYAFTTGEHALYVDSGVDIAPPGYGFYCPVQLPDGAIVTSAEAYVTDNGAGGIVASFYNADLENYSHGTPRTDSTYSLGSGDLIIDLDSINQTVDNSANAYYIVINISDTGTNYGFHGAVVNYTYTEPY